VSSEEGNLQAMSTFLILQRAPSSNSLWICLVKGFTVPASGEPGLGRNDVARLCGHVVRFFTRFNATIGIANFLFIDGKKAAIPHE
jgi:hypothetical protein